MRDSERDPIQKKNQRMKQMFRYFRYHSSFSARFIAESGRQLLCGIKNELSILEQKQYFHDFDANSEIIKKKCTDLHNFPYIELQC